MAPPILDRDRLVDLFVRFAAIEGVPLAERGIADAVASELRSAGIQVIEDQAAAQTGGSAGNLLCFPPGYDWNRPSILLTAHLDTVLSTAKLVPLVDRERITSDGRTILGGDNRAGVSILTYLLLALTENDWPRQNFLVAFTVAEEIGLLGASEIDLSPHNVRAAFVFDCSRRPGVYIKECVGLSVFSAQYIGRAAHAGVAPEEGINAIALASAGISKLRLGRVGTDLTVNIGRISGGEATNVVPDKVEIDGEVRAFDVGRLERQLRRIERTLAEPTEKSGKLLFKTKMEFRPYVHSGDSLIVHEVETALRKAGLTPQPIRYTGGSDANVYNAKGIPAVNLGIGAQKPHTFEEFVLIDDLVKSAEIALALVQA